MLESSAREPFLQLDPAPGKYHKPKASPMVSDENGKHTKAAVPDLAVVRAFLRNWCHEEVAVDRIEISYLRLGAEGQVRLLFEAPAPDGQVLFLAARGAEAASGRRLEARLNEQYTGSKPISGFRKAAVYAPDLKLMFQIFPADYRLKSLPQAMDSDIMTPLLEAVLAGDSRSAKVEDVRVRVLKYKPERKCLVRYEIKWSGTASGAPRFVYGRIVPPKRFTWTREILPRLHDAADGLVFDLPKPLGVFPGLCLELFGHLPGVVLFSLVQAENFPARCRQVGMGLRQFHALPVTLEREWNVEAKVARLEEVAAEFSGMLPAEESRIRRVHDQLAARLQGVPPARSRLIHGDFHGDNVLVEGTRVGLVDFEDCRTGDPADDVGSNLAQLMWHTIKAGERRALPEAGRREFLEGYFAEPDAAVLASLPAHAAMHCFLYGYQCLRHPRDAARYEDAEAMLRACETVLDRGIE